MTVRPFLSVRFCKHEHEVKQNRIPKRKEKYRKTKKARRQNCNYSHDSTFLIKMFDPK